MILTFEVEGRVVTHRVVEVHDDGAFVTTGDANAAPDDLTGLDVRVVGRYWMPSCPISSASARADPPPRAPPVRRDRMRLRPR